MHKLAREDENSYGGAVGGGVLGGLAAAPGAAIFDAKYTQPWMNRAGVLSKKLLASGRSGARGPMADEAARLLSKIHLARFGVPAAVITAILGGASLGHHLSKRE